MNLLDDEVIDDLEYNNLKIIQKKNGFKFGIDSVLLSDFAKELKSNSKVVDIGTGTGIIAILLSGKSRASKIYGIEIQEQISDMAKRSVQLNDLNNIIEIINCNLKDIFSKGIEPNTIDTVVTNPPYMELKTGATSIDKSKLISRHEVECTIDDITYYAGKMLKTKGEFYMVHRTQRLADIILSLRNNNLEPKNIRFIHSYNNKNAELFLIKCVKNGGKQLIVDTPLVVYNKDGSYTDEVLKLYRKI